MKQDGVIFSMVEFAFFGCDWIPEKGKNPQIHITHNMSGNTQEYYPVK